MPLRIALATRNEDRAEPYRQALELAGLEPVTFAPGSAAALGEVSGLVLTGGTDVDPALYGASRLPETDEPDRERDDYESELLREALKRDLPVLAICRGLQLFNVVCGGTLIQHLPNTEKHKRRSGGEPVHEVAVEDRLAAIFSAPAIPVNSRHHQAVDRPGDGIVVASRDPEDGVVEGFVLPSARFAVAVQWHPEDMVLAPDTENARLQARLFAAFADAARSCRKTPRG